VDVKIAWISFGTFLAGGVLMSAHVTMVLKSRLLPDMHFSSVCNKKSLAIQHLKIHFYPKTLSILSYDIGKKVGLRTYQHFLVHGSSTQSHRLQLLLLT
jgi:hypothetical protein